MERKWFLMTDGNGIPITSKDISEIINKCFIELSFVYADMYKKDGKSFISSFIKFKSIRMVCQSIVAEYKRLGAFQEMSSLGDFKDYAEKQPVGELWKQVLADTLLIIYSIIKK